MKELFISPLVVMLVFTSTKADEEQGKKEKSPQLTVALELSVKSFDPNSPTGTLTCVVHNRTKEEIRLPTEYDGRQLVLYGVGKTHRGHSRLWKPNTKSTARSRLVTIEPGKKATVFKVSLKKVLTPHTDRTKGREWAWDWRYRFEPPKTPIHGWRRDGFEESATFFAVVQIGKEKFKSDSIVLAVKAERKTRARRRRNETQP